MSLNATQMASSVFRDHLAMFPTAVDSERENPSTGVPRHNVPEEFIKALCQGFVDAVAEAVINDQSAGTDDVPGVPTPAPFAFPGINSAIGHFLGTQGWDGPDAAKVLGIFVGGPLQWLTTHSILLMGSNTAVGSGAGIVQVLFNPDLEESMRVKLETTLVVAFTSSGFFGQEDVPGAPVNEILAPQLSAYAAALAKGFASIAATITYVGTTSTTVPATGENTGRIV